MTALQEEYFHFGVATGIHGLRGDLKIRPVTSHSTALQDAETIFFRRADGRIEEHTPVRMTSHKGSLLLRLEGLESLEAVESLVGCEVLMRFDQLTELPEDEYYWFELQGMAVVDTSRGDLGNLEDLITTAANDIYVVRGRFGEILIPAVDEFVKEIDTSGNRMMVDLPEGLIPEQE
jgi:16S rRNA processing protein RimM